MVSEQSQVAFSCFEAPFILHNSQALDLNIKHGKLYIVMNDHTFFKIVNQE